MSGSDSSVELQMLMWMSDSDMAEAAQQLMQLSGEDSSSSSSSSSLNSNGNNNNNENKKKKKKKKIKAEMIERSQCEITSAMIEEIFGKEEISRPAKKRRYRLLESIYKDTKAVKVSYGL